MPFARTGSTSRLPLACLFWLLAIPAGWAAPVGIVIGLNGDCIISRGGNRTPATLSQSVEVGDTVEVPTGGKLKLRMADGSMVSLAPGTRMTITTYGVDEAGQRQEAKLTLEKGLVRSEVTPVAGTPARFEIDTAVATAAVRSTDWFVELNGEDMQVNVLKGSVETTSKATRRAVLIPARAASRIRIGRDPTPPARVNMTALNGLVGRTLVRTQVRLPPRGPERPNLERRPGQPDRSHTAARTEASKGVGLRHERQRPPERQREPERQRQDGPRRPHERQR